MIERDQSLRVNESLTGKGVQFFELALGRVSPPDPGTNITTQQGHTRIFKRGRSLITPSKSAEPGPTQAERALVMLGNLLLRPLGEFQLNP
jgi:hypothetical protein